MKKLICFASALMIFGLTSCNSELGPEYTTPPTVSNVTITPHIVNVNDGDKAPLEDVYVGDDVVLEGLFSNTYGWSQIYFSYRTMTVEEYENRTEDEIRQIWIKKFSSNEENMSFTKPFETAPVSNVPFSFRIPSFEEGTKVRWDFGVYNQYGLGFGYIASGYLPEYEYTVKARSLQPVNPQE